MNKFGGGGLILTAIILVILGALLQGFIADVVETIVAILGWILIGAGVILGVLGVVKLFSGNKSGASDY